MLDLIQQGNPAFMLPLTALAAAVVGAALGGAAAHLRGAPTGPWRRAVFHLGLFAFVLGLFAQALGLYEMLQAIEMMGGASPALVAGGLRVSFIAPIYGLTILLVAVALWGGLRYGEAHDDALLDLDPADHGL